MRLSNARKKQSEETPKTHRALRLSFSHFSFLCHPWGENVSVLGELNLTGRGTIPRIEFSSAPSSIYLDHLSNLHSGFGYEIGKGNRKWNGMGKGEHQFVLLFYFSPSSLILFATPTYLRLPSLPFFCSKSRQGKLIRWQYRQMVEKVRS